MFINISHYFTDSILRGPTIASMFMCLTAGLVGVIVFLRKQSLIGESLSHASYPGVILGVITSGLLNLTPNNSLLISMFIMLGASLTALLGIYVINLLVKKLSVRADSALCFVLSSFFGIGLLLASQVQFSYSALYQQIQVYLFGQAATMTDTHIGIYFALSIAISFLIALFYKEIQLIIFDETFAKCIGLKTQAIETLLFFLIVFAVVIGIRSVGVVLMSAMLIAPAVAARQFTNKLSVMFTLSALFGMISGFLGNYFSVESTVILHKLYPGERVSLPTGPMIVMVAAALCILSLCFAPKRGGLIRVLRIAKFRYKCISENILKAIWRHDPEGKISLDELSKYQRVSKTYLKLIMHSLKKQGWILKQNSSDYYLTNDGRIRAAKIIRLHRLWEVYLVDYLGIGAERVHRNAEEMEHIITPQLERELTHLLKDPKMDPHEQPIPPHKEL